MSDRYASEHHETHLPAPDFPVELLARELEAAMDAGQVEIRTRRGGWRVVISLMRTYRDENDRDGHATDAGTERLNDRGLIAHNSRWTCIELCDVAAWRRPIDRTGAP